MNDRDAELIISSLRGYSTEASKVLEYIHKYDYRSEAAAWDTNRNPSLLEVEHPTLYDLFIRLAHYINQIPHRNDNIARNSLLCKNNFESFCRYINASQNTLIAAGFNRIKIEPMKKVAEAFKSLNLVNESAILLNVYNFTFKVRKWYQASKRNLGTPIVLKLEINYDEASTTDLAEDRGFSSFESLFKPSCNYSSKQKRALYDNLKELYNTEDPKTADKIVMAVILKFRKPHTHYHQPFGTKAITECKVQAMAAFERDGKVIRSYTENSLTDPPKLADAHVKRAESIISKSLESI